MTNLLVVEDDDSIRDNLKLLFESQGFTVTVCATGTDADQVLRTKDFNLLLLDWDLPGMNGPDILKNYRTRGGLAPVLMVTGKRETEMKEVAFEAGADDYITKPFSVRELLARVKAMLRRTEQLKESAAAQPAPQIVSRTAEKDPFIGSVFAGKYKLAGVLGEGGSGTVYSGIHLGLNRQVAVKFLHGFLISQTEARRRFEREAKTLSEIHHPNIVQVFDYGIEQGQPFIVLERAEGTPLSGMLKDGKRLPVDEALKIFVQICDALETAHSKGIIHRDLKPGNVLVNKDKDGKFTVKLIDLGMAKNQGDIKLTESGITLGTAPYMSPEQCMGKEVDARSDVYSMGCLMYEVLVGEPPFLAEDHFQVFMKHINDPIPKFASHIQDRAKAGKLETIVTKALQKQPKDRWQNFGELKKQLQFKQSWFPI